MASGSEYKISCIMVWRYPSKNRQNITYFRSELLLILLGLDKKQILLSGLMMTENYFSQMVEVVIRWKIHQKIEIT